MHIDSILQNIENQDPSISTQIKMMDSFERSDLIKLIASRIQNKTHLSGLRGHINKSHIGKLINNSSFGKDFENSKFALAVEGTIYDINFIKKISNVQKGKVKTMLTALEYILPPSCVYFLGSAIESFIYHYNHPTKYPDGIVHF